jgi:hypothetical protein
LLLLLLVVLKLLVLATLAEVDAGCGELLCPKEERELLWGKPRLEDEPPLESDDVVLNTELAKL